MARDEFDQKTKDVIAKRAGYQCANPDCLCPTVGAAADADKSASIGEAAHITAASPGGPRFDASLTPDQRASALNGIWLCATHATLIDKDVTGFPTPLLNKWKADREAAAALSLTSREMAPPSDAHTASFYAARTKEIREEPLRALETRLRKSLEDLKAELRECPVAALGATRAALSVYPYPEVDQFGRKLDKWAIPESAVQSVADRLAPWLGENPHRVSFRLASTGGPMAPAVEDRKLHYEKIRESIAEHKNTLKSTWCLRARRLVGNSISYGLYDELNRFKLPGDERIAAEEHWKARFSQAERSMEAEVETMIDSVVGSESRRSPY